MSETKAPTMCVMSIKRLNAIKDILAKRIDDQSTEEIMKEICDVINFNPDYSKGRNAAGNNEKIKEWRERKANEYGVSVSMVANGKYKLKGKKAAE